MQDKRKPAPVGGRAGSQNPSGDGHPHSTRTLRHSATDLARAADEYAASGWPVFPLRGKEPLRGSNGFRDATTDPERVRLWWKGRPDCNIGTSIPPSLAVVDVDARHGGFDTLRDLEDEHGHLDTLTVITGGGGLHLYFLHPYGEIRQGAGILGAGIDTRIPGKGYVVLPPSLHPSGGRYEWHDPAKPPAEMPRWMIRLLRPQPPAPVARSYTVAATGDARLNGVLSVVSPDGPNWNDRLHWAACRAGEMVRDDGADAQDLARRLLDAAGPYNDREARAAMATIKSGMSKAGVTV